MLCEPIHSEDLFLAKMLVVWLMDSGELAQAYPVQVAYQLVKVSKTKKICPTN